MIALVDKLSQLTDWLDIYVVDGLVNLVGSVSLFGGESLKYINTGRMQFYVFVMAAVSLALGLYMSLYFLPKLPV